MNQLIDLCPYLPEENAHVRPVKSAPDPSAFLLALEALVTAVIGVSIVIGVGAFLLML